MAVCRVYLCTYRRNHLLPRALESLLAQTVDDWVCELHNDDPEDSFPRELVERTGDPRVTIFDHPVNLGAMRSFNLVYRPTAEPFVSLLEDDNWWEPDFLEQMLAAMDLHPESDVAWSNMRIWQEEADGTWTDLGRTTWPSGDEESPRTFDWPDPRQVRASLHSNGALLIRSQDAERYVLPDVTPFQAVELFRERSFRYPLLFVPRPLVNYALTRDTARDREGAGTWDDVQTLAAASFAKHVAADDATWRRIWHESRCMRPKHSITLLLASMQDPDCRFLRQHAKAGDWLALAWHCLKHPRRAWRSAHVATNHPELWEFLDRETAARTREGQRRGPVEVNSH